MPRQAGKPCRDRTCTGIVRDGACSKCGPVRSRRKHGWKPDRERGTARERGYGHNWGKLRAMVLADMPLCNECIKHGQVVAAVTVDHIVPKSQGGDDSLENLQSLCKQCHQTKTGREGWKASRGLNDTVDDLD